MAIIYVLIGIAIAIFLLVSASVKIISQRTASVVERLGKYQKTLEAGFHIIVPIIDRIAYKHTLKEQSLDVGSQSCITNDNIAVEVDGILYLQVIDAKKASYGIDNYLFASTQIAQTTMRSIIGRLDLDKTFEEREAINTKIVEAVDLASESWGIKVTRYEISNIIPPQSIKDAMEKQMRAEREKRALIAESEGEKQAKINRAEGDKGELISRSEGEKQKRINEAEGRASEIKKIAEANAIGIENEARGKAAEIKKIAEANAIGIENEAQGKAAEIEKIAEATAIGIEKIALSLSKKGGNEALNLRVAEQYLEQFGKLAKKGNTMILPSNLTDVASIVSTITSVVGQEKKK